VAALVGVIVGDLDATPAPASLAWLAILGLTSQSLGYLLISLSLSRLPAVLTSMILLSQPVVTVGLGIVLLAEAPTTNQLLGVALVIGGIAVATVPFDRVRASLRSAPA
jgi:drug/metabolite transporter (DMT)-like permease